MTQANVEPLLQRGEMLGGIALIIGWQTRYVALVLTPILLGAIATVHAKAGFFFDSPKGGWEYPAFWIVALLVQALLGDGAYSLQSTRAEGQIVYSTEKLS
jgi:putative oxidoreductase